MRGINELKESFLLIELCYKIERYGMIANETATHQSPNKVDVSIQGFYSL